MKIEERKKFTIDIPVAYFMPADFKSKTTFYKHLDTKYDIRKQFKDLYRYYSDIYVFNKRDGDCIKMNTKSLKSYGLIVSPSINDFVTKSAVITAITRLRDYILKEEYNKQNTEDVVFSIQLCTDGIAPFIDEDELDGILRQVFMSTNITIFKFGGAGI